MYTSLELIIILQFNKKLFLNNEKRLANGSICKNSIIKFKVRMMKPIELLINNEDNI
jgi:hypothetical protein